MKLKIFYFKRIYSLKTIPYLDLIIESKEHLVEIRERFFQFLFLGIFHIVCFFFSLDILCNFVIRILPEIQFFQLSPQEYFLTSFFVGINFSILSIFPNLFKFFIFFLSPSLILKEKKTLFPIVSISTLLSLLAIFFSYYILAPTTLRFFLDYNSKNIEPFWSFNDFSTFFFRLIYITILLFQIPLLQIFLCSINLVNKEEMIKNWKIIVCLSFLIGGILTPSTDPFTQFLLSLVICFLYGMGIFFFKFIY